MAHIEMGDQGHQNGLSKRIIETRLLHVWDLVIRQELTSAALPLILLGLALAIFHRGFFSAYNNQSLLTQSAIFTIVGLSQLAVLSIGQMNLALPAISVSSGMLLAYLVKSENWSFLPATLTALALGIIMGLLQGVLIAFAKLNPFIVTLGLASFYSGLMFAISRGAFFADFPGMLGNMGSKHLFALPVITWIAIVSVFASFVIFYRTLSGREMLAVGANARAALFSAIPVGRNIVKAHTLSGFFAATAAIVAIADLGTADTSLGQSWLLPSFAAPVLGGAILLGGRVSAAGTALGAMILVLVNSGLIVLGVNQYWYQAGLGIVVLMSVLLGEARIRYAFGRGMK
jgi:ribose transport system permease protein